MRARLYFLQYTIYIIIAISLLLWIKNLVYGIMSAYYKMIYCANIESNSYKNLRIEPAVKRLFNKSGNNIFIEEPDRFVNPITKISSVLDLKHNYIIRTAIRCFEKTQAYFFDKLWHPFYWVTSIYYYLRRYTKIPPFLSKIINFIFVVLSLIIEPIILKMPFAQKLMQMIESFLTHLKLL